MVVVVVMVMGRVVVTGRVVGAGVVVGHPSILAGEPPGILAGMCGALMTAGTAVGLR